MKKLLRYWQTVKYLKAVQVYGRFWFRLYRPHPDERPAPLRRCVSNLFVPVCRKAPSMTSPDEFKFLSQSASICSPSDWNKPSLSKLWLYNLHYFDDFNAKGSDVRVSWHKDLAKRWIQDNPIGEGNGWEPYPTSLRLVNWIKWVLQGQNPDQEIIHSLAVQARWLRKRLEIHLLGNHLFANAKALIFAGLFFQGDEAEKWLKKGLDLLARELPEQVLDDGGHFERSPMYHAIILEDLLDLVNILRSYGRTVPQSWFTSIDKMFTWLYGMSHPDGEISFFNDATFGIAPCIDTLLAYSNRLEVIADAGNRPEDGLTFFEQTGYLRWQHQAAVALLDVAPIGPDYLPGHAHADSLSFELSLFDQRVFVNSGTSQYGNNAERQKERGTAAHNTVVVNEANSSDVWGAFRVAQRAKITHLAIDSDSDFISVDSAHDGYTQLPGKPVHRRKWKFRKGVLQIIDQLSSHQDNAAVLFHLHPAIVILEKAGNHVTLRLPSGNKVKLLVTKGESLNLVPSTWHPGFGESLTTSMISIPFSSRENVTEIFWDDLHQYKSKFPDSK